MSPFTPSLASLLTRTLFLALVALASLAQSGCYYGHLASGQIEILWQRQPIEAAIEDPSHPKDVRELLRLVDSVRRFARDLGLEVDGQYTSYVDWPGDRLVTTLVRTRANSLELVPWWFPLVGELPYKGYFDRARAEAEAERLVASGEYDVCVSGVAAYSTLGWIEDPVTQPMLRRGAASLVETLFHELVHATAFLPDDADFNEGVAQFIGQQAAIRFFAAAESGALELDRRPDRERAPGSDPERASAVEARWLPSSAAVADSIADRERIAETTNDFMDRLRRLDGAPDRPRLRAALEAEARGELAALPLRVLDSVRVAASARLSDACLALRGTYSRDLPRHAELLASLGGDLPAMIERLRHFEQEARPSEEFFLPEHAARASGATLSGR